MRRYFIGAVVAIALVVGAMPLFLGALPAGAQGQSPQEQGQVYALHVDGLACPFCAYGIEKELTGLHAVEKVEIDMNRGVVLVTLAPGARVAEALFRKAVANAGFTLREVEGPESKQVTK